MHDMCVSLDASGSETLLVATGSHLVAFDISPYRQPANAVPAEVEEDMDGEILLGLPDEDDLLTVCNSPHPGRPHIFAGGRNHQLVQYTLQGEEVHAYDLPGFASATVAT